MFIHKPRKYSRDLKEAAKQQEESENKEEQVDTDLKTQGVTTEQTKSETQPADFNTSQRQSTESKDQACGQSRQQSRSNEVSNIEETALD